MEGGLRRGSSSGPLPLPQSLWKASPCQAPGGVGQINKLLMAGQVGAL